jgi:RNA polymerase sigma factor (sigma-70 family)
VAFELRARGVTPERANGEDEEAFANRIGTRLMALYRDTRSGESFDALYAFARPAVLRWIQSLVARGRSPLDPVELLQDTFVNVYRYPGSFREEHAGSFRVWVRTIAGNLVRRSSSARSRVSLQELPEGLQEPADPREGPEARVARAEALGCLRSAWVVFLSQYARAWEGLAQRDRRALHLVEVEGQSYERAGEILRVGRSNMKMIVFRARKRIARRMRAAMAPAAAAGRAEGAGTFASRARAGRATGGRSALAGPDGRGLARTSGVA